MVTAPAPVSTASAPLTLTGCHVASPRRKRVSSPASGAGTSPACPAALAVAPVMVEIDHSRRSIILAGSMLVAPCANSTAPTQYTAGCAAVTA